MLQIFIDTIESLVQSSGLAQMTWANFCMILISFLFMFLAIKKGFEPLLLLPIAFGMLLTNLPATGMYHPELWNIDGGQQIDFAKVLHEGGLLDLLYIGVKLQIYPALIFLGIGCMTDFAPLIANPKSFLLGAAAQAGIFVTFLGAAALGFAPKKRVRSPSSAARTDLHPYSCRLDCCRVVNTTWRSVPSRSRRIRTWHWYR